MNEKICKIQYIPSSLIFASVLQEFVFLRHLSKVIFICPPSKGKGQQGVESPLTLYNLSRRILCVFRESYIIKVTRVIWPNMGIQDVGICELERRKGNVSFHPNNNKSIHFFPIVSSSGLECE